MPFCKHNNSKLRKLRSKSESKCMQLLDGLEFFPYKISLFSEIYYVSTQNENYFFTNLIFEYKKTPLIWHFSNRNYQLSGNTQKTELTCKAFSNTHTYICIYSL